MLSDTHQAHKRLQEAGASEELAEAVVGLFGSAEENLATKRDLKELEKATKRDLKELEKATKRDLKELEKATKRDLKELEKAMKRDLKEVEMQLRNEMRQQTVRIYGAIALAAAILGVMNFLT